MYKIDLHTHSISSPDGGITEEQYMQLLEDGVVDCIAVTDHNSTATAERLNKMLGSKIIIGEEIMSRDGEIVGLFLNGSVRPGMPARETMLAIRKQQGIVYIPHPFETVRRGLSREVMEVNADLIDIVEAYNGRAVVQNKGPEAAVWARLHQKPTSAASDAHGARGVGTAYTVVAKLPNRHNLVELMTLGHLTMKRPPMHTLFYPKFNKLMSLFRGR